MNACFSKTDDGVVTYTETEYNSEEEAEIDILAKWKKGTYSVSFSIEDGMPEEDISKVLKRHGQQLLKRGLI